MRPQVADSERKGVTPQPTLVLMAGPPGAGKTTLALAIGHARGWPVIDKDTLKSAMLTVGVAEALAGPGSYELLNDLGRDFDRVARPSAGRYAHAPAIADEGGVVSVPPPVADLTPLAMAGAAAAVGLLLATMRRTSRT